ncbi:MAG: hypothetical protein IKC97_08105 [Clostridia bacterium]|nr:hypothetical protein [Clostridia bacterium]
MKRASFYIDRKSWAARLSLLFMAVSAIIRGIYYTVTPMTALVLWVHFVNVIAAAVVFGVAVIFFGEKCPQLTAVSVLMGVVFFMVKAFTFETMTHTVLCLILYTAVLVLYSLTIFGIIRTKYLLYPLFGLPLLYHIFVEDMQIYILADPQPPFFEWLPEISVLCIMAALLCVSVAMKKRVR